MWTPPRTIEALLDDISTLDRQDAEFLRRAWQALDVPEFSAATHLIRSPGGEAVGAAIIESFRIRADQLVWDDPGDPSGMNLDVASLVHPTFMWATGILRDDLEIRWQVALKRPYSMGRWLSDCARAMGPMATDVLAGLLPAWPDDAALDDLLVLVRDFA